MRTKSDSAADCSAQAPQQITNDRTELPPLLVDEQPDDTGALSMSIGFDEDGCPAAMIVHGARAADMRRALLKLAAEQGDGNARHQLAELKHAKSRAAIAAESAARIKRSLLRVK